VPEQSERPAATAFDLQALPQMRPPASSLTFRRYFSQPPLEFCDRPEADKQRFPLLPGVGLGPLGERPGSRSS
jgi:hypothetical protein